MKLSNKVFQHTSYNLSRRPVCQYTRVSDKVFQHTSCNLSRRPCSLSVHETVQKASRSADDVARVLPCTRHEWPGLEPGGDKTVTKLSGCRSQRGSRVLFAAPYIDSPKCRIKGLAFEISAVFGTPVFVVTPGKDAMLGFLRLLCSLQR